MNKEIIQNSRILIVDDQIANIQLLERILKGAGYQNWTALTDSRKALAAFTELRPDLVALDWRMPNMDGLSLLKQLRSRVPAGEFVPTLILTADNSRTARQEALSAGAKDFLNKPLDVSETLLRIYNLLETRWLHVELKRHNETLEQKVQERTRDLESAQLEVLQRLALAAEYRDDCTGQHAQRVGRLSAVLGRAIGLPASDVELLRRSAPLHDIGKIGIPDGILLKSGKLTSDEYVKVKTHTDIGRVILSGSRFPVLQMAERIALYHHERWDGSGYYGLAGEAIPVEARIVSVADVYDVITHERPYKKAQSPADALALLQEESGKQFDPNLVQVLLELNLPYDLAVLSQALDREQEWPAATINPELQPSR
jgi:putative two-component system response regulator